MPVVVAEIIPTPEHRGTVLDELRSAVEAVHLEVGCQLYALHETSEGFVLIESWASDQALEQHDAGDVVRILGAALEGRLAQPLRIARLSPIPVGSSDKGMVRVGG